MKDRNLKLVSATVVATLTVTLLVTSILRHYVIAQYIIPSVTYRTVFVMSILVSAVVSGMYLLSERYTNSTIGVWIGGSIVVMLGFSTMGTTTWMALLAGIAFCVSVMTVGWIHYRLQTIRRVEETFVEA